MNRKILTFLLLAVFFHAGCSKNEQSGTSVKKSPAPDFLIYDLAMKPVKLADFRGKVLLLDFWATWCPPCREEIPHLKELYEKYSSQGLVILGVSMDDGGSSAVMKFVQENTIPYPVAMEGDKIAGDYGGIEGIPTAFLIDRQGNIVTKLAGYHSYEDFESLIKPLL